jgi:hypothetical protein
MRLNALAALAAAGACAAASADVVIPNANTTVGSTTGLNTFIRDINAPRAGQLLIDPSQLNFGPGEVILGLAFRMYTGATTAFPQPDATWADYTINVGEGVAMGTQTTTFASNFVGAPTNVRSGPLTMLAGTYGVGAVAPAANPFGPTIMFDTPYVYTGGPLLIEIRHTGSNITNPANSFLDAVASNPSLYWSATATTYAATTGTAASFTITKLVTIPAPGSVALLGLGGLLAARRRR